MRGLLATAIVMMAGPCLTATVTPALVSAQAAQSPAPDSPPVNALQITNGPVIEQVTETGAIIAWSTNVNAGTELHYGTTPDRLDQRAGMPWGGLTHRVELKNLSPGTKYFFRAESPHGQGTGEDAQSAVSSFQTKSEKDFN